MAKDIDFQKLFLQNLVMCRSLFVNWYNVELCPIPVFWPAEAYISVPKRCSNHDATHSPYFSTPPVFEGCSALQGMNETGYHRVKIVAWSQNLLMTVSCVFSLCLDWSASHTFVCAQFDYNCDRILVSLPPGALVDLNQAGQCKVLCLFDIDPICAYQCLVIIARLIAILTEIPTLFSGYELATGAVLGFFLFLSTRRCVIADDRCSVSRSQTTQMSIGALPHSQ